MILVLATAIGVGIGLPFTFGKTVALLSVSIPSIIYAYATYVTAGPAAGIAYPSSAYPCNESDHGSCCGHCHVHSDSLRASRVICDIRNSLSLRFVWRG